VARALLPANSNHKQNRKPSSELASGRAQGLILWWTSGFSHAAGISRAGVPAPHIQTHTSKLNPIPAPPSKENARNAKKNGSAASTIVK